MATLKELRRYLTVSVLLVMIGCTVIPEVIAQDKSAGQDGVGTKPVSVQQEPLQQPVVSGKPDEEKALSFDFPDTDIRVAIETIAIKIGVNIVAGPEVKGKISMKLENVPWRKALDILLKTYGYGYVWDEGIIRVMSVENLKREEMMTRVFSIQYGSPAEIARGITALLSKDGKLEANETAKSIIVKDYPTSLSSIEKTIEKLDLLSREEQAKKVVVPEKKELPAEPTEKKEITLDFKETPIRDAMAQISALSGVFISVGEEVTTKVTLSTGGQAVPWQRALQTIIQTADLAYEPSTKLLSDLKAGDFITIRTKDKIIEINDKNKKISEGGEVIYEVFVLKYIDAWDLKKALFPEQEAASVTQNTGGVTTSSSSTPANVSFLSSRGKAKVLEMSGQTGWPFNTDYKQGAMGVGQRGQDVPNKPPKSNVLLISDVPANMGNIRRIIREMDVMPYQISIEAKVIEVARDVLTDIGFEWGSGYNGIEQGLTSGTVVTQKISQGGATVIDDVKIGLQNLGYATGMTPATFTPDSTGLSPSTSGFKFKMEKLLNTQVEVMLHMLEENYGANILSAPKIMAYSNQEASIIIGTQYPIVTTTITTGTTATTTVQLDYYQNIGVRLSVVPQVSDDCYINMLLHPAVTTSNSDLEIKNDGGFTIAKYPIIQTREADTRVLLKDGETIVIGGLLKDEKKETRIGVPFFADLPFVGAAFRRSVNDTKKMDLLIFVTAHIVLKNRQNGQTESYVVTKEQAEQFAQKRAAAKAE